MRLHLLSALLLAAALMCTSGCKSDQERSAESLAAFAEAVVIDRAPYHAYALLDTDDKEHVSVEAWASGFEEREPLFPAGTAITVGDLSIKGDRAEASVKITPPSGDADTRKYVLRREGTKWRIWLGLRQLEEMRATLADAARIAEDGAVEQAREKVESVAEKGFPASMPHAIEREVLVLRQKLGNRERFVELDGRFNAALQADAETMRTEYEALAEQVGPDDEAFFPRLENLKKELAKVEKQAAVDGFEFADVKARQFRDAWGLFREVRFKAKNNTGRPLKKLAVRVELKNEGSETPLGTLVWQLIEDGGTMEPNKVIDVKREIEKAPDDWQGRDVIVGVDELEFVGSEPNEG